MDSYISDDDGPDNIEHFISLLEAIRINKYDDAASFLKKLFREDIEGYTVSLKPRLIFALLEIHEIKKEQEKLVGVLTTNYDNLLDLAFEEKYGLIDYGFITKS